MVYCIGCTASSTAALGGRRGSADMLTTSTVRLPLFALLRTTFLRSIGLHQLTFLRKNPHKDFQIGERGNCALCM